MTHNAETGMACDEGTAVEAEEATNKLDELAVTADTKEKTEKVNFDFNNCVWILSLKEDSEWYICRN